MSRLAPQGKQKASSAKRPASSRLAEKEEESEEECKLSVKELREIAEHAAKEAAEMEEAEIAALEAEEEGAREAAERQREAARAKRAAAPQKAAEKKASSEKKTDGEKKERAPRGWTLNFSHGRPVAKCIDAGQKGLIYIAEAGAACECPNDTSPLLLLGEKWLKASAKKLYGRALSPDKLDDLERAIISKTAPADAKLTKLWRAALAEFENAADTEIVLTSGAVIPIPTTDTDVEREVIAIAGPSGVGKTTFSGKWVEQWKMRAGNEGKEFHVFSRVAEDPAIDDLAPNRHVLDATFLGADVKAEDLADSVVLFDDIDTILDKRVRDKVIELRKDCLEIGRHLRINCIVTSHQLMNWGGTRDILNEATTQVMFPKGGAYHIRRYLREYAGLDSPSIAKIMKLQTRWVCLNKAYPRTITHETGIYLVD